MKSAHSQRAMTSERVQRILGAELSASLLLRAGREFRRVVA